MLARPPKGAAGQGGKVGGKNTGGNVWAGTITDLTSGNNYDVQIVMEVVDNKFGGHTYFSATQNIKVK